MIVLGFWLILGGIAAIVAAIIAAQKGRRLIKWVPYTLVAWPIALPHLLMKRNRRHF